MKYIAFVILTNLALISFSQKNKGGEKNHNSKELDLKKDFNISGKSVIKKSKQVALTKVALHFKKITNNQVYVGKGNDKVSASAWAILEGVSDQTFQSIADEFYKRLNDKLKAEGLAITDWNTVTSAKNFDKVNDKQIKKHWSNKNIGLINVYTANEGPHCKQVIGNPGIWSAYAKLGKELKSNPIALDIIIDFARFDLKMKQSGYYFRTTSANSNVYPQISIEKFSGANGFNTISTNLTAVGKYGEASIITMKKNIYFEDEFAQSIDSHSGKLPESMQKKISFGTNLTTGTFVINVDEEAYKTAVLNALDTYTDYMIAQIKLIRK